MTCRYFTVTELLTVYIVRSAILQYDTFSSFKASVIKFAYPVLNGISLMNTNHKAAHIFEVHLQHNQQSFSESSWMSEWEINKLINQISTVMSNETWNCILLLHSLLNLQWCANLLSYYYYRCRVFEMTCTVYTVHILLIHCTLYAHCTLLPSLLRAGWKMVASGSHFHYIS